MRVVNPLLTREWLLSLYTGHGVELALIDGGVDPTHPALLNKISRALIAVSGYNEAASVVELPVEDSRDESGHGSAAAGLIAGIAPGARIASVRVFDGTRTCSRQAANAALAWAIESGIRLIYMSVSTRSEEKAARVKSLCELAYRRNCIVVAPLENSGCLSFPAAFPTVIGVDCGNFGSVYDVRYQQGAKVEYVAHGMRIPAPSVAGDYVRVSGTSFASANVTGLIALILEAFPGISVFEVKAILKAFSENAGRNDCACDAEAPDTLALPQIAAGSNAAGSR